MHDTCHCANATALEIRRLVGEAGIAHFGADAWQALPAEQREVLGKLLYYVMSLHFICTRHLARLRCFFLSLFVLLDFLCANHTRQLPIDAFDRLFDAWLKEELEGDDALQQAGSHARLELSGKKVIFCDDFSHLRCFSLSSLSFVCFHSNSFYYR